MLIETTAIVNDTASLKEKVNGKNGVLLKTNTVCCDKKIYLSF